MKRRRRGGRPSGLSGCVPGALVMACGLAAQEPQGPGEPPPVPSWLQALDQLEFYGDFRLRHESTFDVPVQPDRHRERLRVRLGVNYSINDELLLGVRAVTGNPDDPRSPHVTFGDGFDGLEVSLDRAFLTWRPEAVPGAFVTAGKFAHPLVRNPVYGELVWDADVQPEGLVAGGSVAGLLGLDRAGLIIGGYTLVEQAGGAEALAWIAELSAQHRWGEQFDSTVALGFYGYSNPTPGGSRLLLADNAGNATVDRDGDGTPDAFASDFAILNPVVALSWGGKEMPLAVAAEFIHNLRAEGAADTGWAAGLGWGRTEKAGDWRLYYQFQVVEQEAVFSPFSQDDLVLGTGHRSHVFGVNRQLTDTVGMHLWGLVSRPEGGTDDADRWRLRLDLNVKF